MEETQIPKSWLAGNIERKKFSFEWTQTPRYGDPH